MNKKPIATWIDGKCSKCQREVTFEDWISWTFCEDCGSKVNKKQKSKKGSIDNSNRRLSNMDKKIRRSVTSLPAASSDNKKSRLKRKESQDDIELRTSGDNNEGTTNKKKLSTAGINRATSPNRRKKSSQDIKKDVSSPTNSESGRKKKSSQDIKKDVSSPTNSESSKRRKKKSVGDTTTTLTKSRKSRENIALKDDDSKKNLDTEVDNDKNTDDVKNTNDSKKDQQPGDRSKSPGKKRKKSENKVNTDKDDNKKEDNKDINKNDDDKDNKTNDKDDDESTADNNKTDDNNKTPIIKTTPPERESKNTQNDEETDKSASNLSQGKRNSTKSKDSKGKDRLTKPSRNTKSNNEVSENDGSENSVSVSNASKRGGRRSTKTNNKSSATETEDVEINIKEEDYLDPWSCVAIVGGECYEGQTFINYIKRHRFADNILAITCCEEAEDIVRNAGATRCVVTSTPQHVKEYEYVLREMECEVLFYFGGDRVNWLRGNNRWSVPTTADAKAMVKLCQIAGVPRLIAYGGHWNVFKAVSDTKVECHCRFTQEDREKVDEKAKALAKAEAKQEEPPEFEPRIVHDHRLTTIFIEAGFVWGKGESKVFKEMLISCLDKNYGWIAMANYVTSTCHCRNLAEALVVAGYRGKSGELYSCTDGEPVQFNQFVADLVNTHGLDVPESQGCLWLKKLCCLGGGLAHVGRAKVLNDITTRKELGYTAHVTHDEGFGELERDYRKRYVEPKESMRNLL